MLCHLQQVRELQVGGWSKTGVGWGEGGRPCIPPSHQATGPCSTTAVHKAYVRTQMGWVGWDHRGGGGALVHGGSVHCHAFRNQGAMLS